jgi:hypothetical protein
MWSIDGKMRSGVFYMILSEITYNPSEIRELLVESLGEGFLRDRGVDCCERDSAVIRQCCDRSPESKHHCTCDQ